LNQGLDHIIFINLLASKLLIVLAEPIIRLLFERGKFDFYATRNVTQALVCLAPGLLAFSIVNILARAFYALGDTKTPMMVSIFCLGINLFLAAVLVRGWRQGGLGVANTSSAVLNVCLLFHALRRKLKRLDLDSIKNTILHMALALALAGLAAWASARWWTHTIGHANLARRLGEVFVPMTLSSLIYWGVTLWFKVPPAVEMFQLVMQRFQRGPAVPTESR
jgi:putative peptidoglycan lipid II flippase